MDTWLMTSFAERLHAARIRAGYSAMELARFARVGDAKVGRWEGGEAIPTADEVARICAVVGCAPAALFGPSLLNRMGYDPAGIEASFSRQQKPPAPRRSLKGWTGKKPPALVPLRCACGRWVPLQSANCRRCDPDVAQSAPARALDRAAIPAGAENGRMQPSDPDGPVRAS